MLKRKCYFLFVFFICFTMIFPVYLFSKRQNKKDAYRIDEYKNSVQIIGINLDSHLLAYIRGIRNTGKADIKYQCCVIDYKMDKVIYRGETEYISDLYMEGYIQTDWTDPKYSADAYIKLKKDYIDNILLLYEITPFFADSIDFQQKKVISKIKKLNGLSEDLYYRVDFLVNDREYYLEKEDINTSHVLDINLSVIYETDDFFITVIEFKYAGLEENYYDYKILGVKKLS